MVHFTRGKEYGPVAFVVVGLRIGHQAGGFRPPLASPSRMLMNGASPGSDARHSSADVILGFAEYAVYFPIYRRLSFSLFAL